MAQVLPPNEMFVTQFEPTIARRGICYIDGIPTFLLSAWDQPSMEHGTTEIPHINTQFYVKGRSKPKPITITVYDVVAPSTAQIIEEWSRLHHEAVTGRDGYSDFYKKDITLNVLGPAGDLVREWVLKGAFIQDIANGKIDWSSDEHLKTDLTIQYDYYILEY